MGCLAFIAFALVLVSLDWSIADNLRFQSSNEEKRHFTTNIKITDKHGLESVFDGIGGISGGGATSKLLVGYPEKQRNEILDFLFKPDYAASLNILKVEIGGDSQSTDGSESSHMHEPNDENYNRGYEWWMMKEAKKRNPDIKLYGLPWVFPGWLGGEKKESPYGNFTALTTYYLNWIKGAKSHHNLDIDYLGIWNERDVNIEFVKYLRKRLDNENFSHIQLVVNDAMNWKVVDDLKKDSDYLNAIDVVGQHYPAASSPIEARTLGKKLWASEEFSQSNELYGGGCWARILTESYALGHMTAFISWNLIASYYRGLNYDGDGLMTADEPWSGHYSVKSPIWITAHHTHFYQPGWKYLPHGHGVGMFEGNGTYVTLTNPDLTDLTIILNTMDPANARCFYSMPEYTIASKQSVFFELDGRFKHITTLYTWYTKLDFVHEENSVFFKQGPVIHVTDGRFSLMLSKNELITVTTILKSERKNFPSSPQSSPFPLPYFDDFESYSIDQEPFNFAQQTGAYEVTRSKDRSHNLVMTQVLIQSPIDTCSGIYKQITSSNIIGDISWRNTKVKMDMFINKTENGAADGVFLASQVSNGNCDIVLSTGFYFYINLKDKSVELSLNHNRSIVVQKISLKKNLYNKWFTVQLDVEDEHVEGRINDEIIIAKDVPRVLSKHGFVAFGPSTFGRASFDNFVISRADRVSNEEVTSFIARRNFREI